MDSPTTTTSTSNFSTPPRILIPKLVRSRDQWKAKATARKRQYRKEQIHSRDLKISRQQWKERALAAEQKINDLHQQLQQSQADLADARSEIAQREDDAQKN
jgi:predicted  nucleic acid-binding Zn-ribbon protein